MTKNVTQISSGSKGNTQTENVIETETRNAKEVFPWLLRDVDVPFGTDASILGNEYLPNKRTNYAWNEYMVWRVLEWIGNPCNTGALIFGNPGSGKTSFIENIGAYLNIPVITKIAHKRMDFESLLISKTAVKGTILDLDGPLLKAMKKGYWFVLDETRLAPTDCITSLNEIVENSKTLVPDINNRLLTAHPNFRIIFLDNTNLRGDSTGQFATAKVNDTSVVDRLRCFKTSYPTPAQEAKFLVAEVKQLGKPGRNDLPLPYAEAYVELANYVREMHDGVKITKSDDMPTATAKSGIDHSNVSADQTFSTRRLLQFALIMMDMGDLKPSEFPDEYERHYEAALMEAGWMTAEPSMALAVRQAAKDIIG